MLSGDYSRQHKFQPLGSSSGPQVRHCFQWSLTFWDEYFCFNSLVSGILKNSININCALKIFKKYSFPSNNMGLNCVGQLTHGFFSFFFQSILHYYRIQGLLNPCMQNPDYGGNKAITSRLLDEHLWILVSKTSPRTYPLWILRNNHMFCSILVR